MGIRRIKTKRIIVLIGLLLFVSCVNLKDTNKKIFQEYVIKNMDSLSKLPFAKIRGRTLITYKVTSNKSTNTVPSNIVIGLPKEYVNSETILLKNGKGTNIIKKIESNEDDRYVFFFINSKKLKFVDINFDRKIYFRVFIKERYNLYILEKKGNSYWFLNINTPN